MVVVVGAICWGFDGYCHINIIMLHRWMIMTEHNIPFHMRGYTLKREGKERVYVKAKGRPFESNQSTSYSIIVTLLPLGHGHCHGRNHRDDFQRHCD